jgi:Sensors of blue-light using FAD
MLRRLAWSSIPSSSFSAARLNEIVGPSRRNNERDHLSGMLLFTGAHFLGILEGEEQDLGNLWLRLRQDERHCDLIRIGDDLCGERWFPAWTMAYTDHAVVGAQIDRLRSPQAWIKSKWAEMIHPIMLRADSM